MKALIAIALIFLGCMSNVAFLEVLVKEDPGIGNLLTFCQYSFIAVEGFFFTAKCGMAKKKIGTLSYVILVVLYFLGCITNNYAFDFNLPIILQIVFRSGTLLATMLLSKAIKKRRYPKTKYLCVFLITTGLIMFSLASEQEAMAKIRITHDNLFWWIIGVILLISALMMTARLRLYHEILYRRYGKHHREALYYTHALPLPLFALLAPDIMKHWRYAMDTPPVEIGFGFVMPIAILYLILNVISHYICVSSVFVLTAERSSLIVTLVLTLRKFGSMIFSIWFYEKPFTLYHHVGALLIFTGTTLYSGYDIIYTEIRRRKYRHHFH